MSALAFSAALILLAAPIHVQGDQGASGARAKLRGDSHSTAPASVTLVGSLQSELGCGGDWDPACSATHLLYDASSQVWRRTFFVPAGTFEYRAALNNDFTETYGSAGGNRQLTIASARNVTFYYSHATHWITSNADATSVIATVAGNFQSELGCSGDWQPQCLNSWLQDPEEDGTYTFFTTALPMGNYEGKVTLNESWDINYGDGGAPGGNNIPFNVPYNNAPMDFTWDGTTHILTVAVRQGSHDGSVSASDLFHDSRDLFYRTPAGAVSAGTSVKVRLRALAGDLTGADVRIWNDRTNSQSFVPMTVVASETLYEWWEGTIATGTDPTILWYRFVAKDGSGRAYYEDDVARDGGSGGALASSSDRAWQLTVHDPAFTTPDWVKNGVVYQIFPDRFRNGNTANDTPAGSFFYGEAGGTIRETTWNTPVCDPRDPSPCPNKFSNNFYGGDLQGIVDKLSYLSGLGVTVLYLNPIFESPSNHKYDTSDYSAVDDNLGDLALFQTLTNQAHAFGMKVVLDGAFNYTSSNSKYFDRYGRYGDLGACESTSAPYRSSYYFQSAAPGAGVCAGNTLYEGFFGYDALPKLNSANAATRSLIWDSLDSVARTWLDRGADGWRLDVGGDIDAGLISDPSNNYWEGFRSAVRAQKSDAWIVGEEWGVATSWTLGSEWDSAINYQLSTAILGFWRDETFTDSDHNSSSSIGVLSPLSASQFDARLRNLQERYPRESWYAMMNVLGTHDTSRALFMLDHNADQNNEALYENVSYDWSDAIVRLKGAALLQMTLPGAPTIYYGDEVGLVGPMSRANGEWQDDPYNRQPYPWLDQAGTPFYPHLRLGGAGETLLAHYQLLTATRAAHAALRTGTFDTLRVDDANKIYAYGRRMANLSDAAVVVINRSATGPQTIAIDVSGYLPVGAVLQDVMTSTNYTVSSGGMLTVTNVPARSGALLVLTSAATAPPSAPANLALGTVGATSVGLTWSAAAGASSYDVYKSLVSGGGYTFAGNAATNSFTVTGLTTAVRYYFVVVSRNATTGLVSGYSNEVSAVASYDLSNSSTSWFNLQWPPTINHTISATNTAGPVYGQVHINGVTDASSTALAGIRMQAGYGPDGSAPGSNWQWFEMAFDSNQGSNDQYAGSLLPDQVGMFDYAIRVSGDGGTTWWYGDQSGPRRTGTLALPGELVVNSSGDATAPDTPQALSITGTDSDSISLSWGAVTDGALAGYELYREAVASPGYARLATIASGTTSYNDTSVTSGAAYRYYVKAYDTSLNRSAASNVVEATAAVRYVNVTITVTVPAFTPTASTVYLTGNIPALGEWQPNGVAMTKTSATQWTHTLQLLDGTQFDFKATRGSWETVGRNADGSVDVTVSTMAVYGANGTQAVGLNVENWRDPLVTAVSPTSGAVSVATSATIVVTWSRNMASATDFAVSYSGGTVAGTFSTSGNTTTFTPAQPLRQGTLYTVNVAGEVGAAGDTQQVLASWSFTTLCNVATPVITAGSATSFCTGGSVTLTSSSATGNQWHRNGAPIGGANGTTFVASTSGAYTVVVTFEGCTTAPSNTINVTLTTTPSTPSISANGPTTFCTGGSVTLTSSNATGNQWYRDGLLLGGQTAQTLVATVAGSYAVQSSEGNCSSGMSSAVAVTVNAKPVFNVTAPATMFSQATSSASIDASCTGSSITWSISGGTITAGQGTSRVAFVAGAAGTLTLTVTVTNSLGCSDTKSANVIVELAAFGAPPYFAATANGSSANLQWAAVQSAAQYEVFRSTDNVNWSLRGSSNTTSFADSGLEASTAYLYRVRAVRADTTASSFSAIDFATTAPFTRDLTTCAPVIRAVDIIELRSAINLVRARVGLSSFAFTDPSLAAGQPIKALHITELRSALAPALAAINVTPTYTDATITAGVTTAKAVHVEELRGLVR